MTGWAFDEGSLLKDEALGRHIMRGLDTSLPITDILMRLNGNFAVVVVGPRPGLAAVGVVFAFDDLGLLLWELDLLFCRVCCRVCACCC